MGDTVRIIKPSPAGSKIGQPQTALRKGAASSNSLLPQTEESIYFRWRRRRTSLLHIRKDLQDRAGRRVEFAEVEQALWNELDRREPPPAGARPRVVMTGEKAA